MFNSSLQLSCICVWQLYLHAAPHAVLRMLRRMPLRMMLRMLPHRAAHAAVHAAVHAAPHATARAVAAHVHVDPAWCYGFRCACSEGNFAKTKADGPQIKRQSN